MRPGAAVAASVLAATVFIGCATDSASRKAKKAKQEPDRSARPGATDLWVEKLVIRGVESFPVRKIKNGLATRKDPGWRSKIPIIGPKRKKFNVLDWEKDLERIRTFYKSRGYFNVRILRETVDRNPEEGTVRLLVKISEGEKVNVEKIEVEGLASAEAFDRDSLLKGLPLQEGEIFTQQAYLETKSKMIERLQRNGYAYAEMEGRAYVYPESSKAHVRFIADPGPQAVFGEIRVKGLETVPESHVRRVLPFESGDPYSSEAIEEGQQAIYRLEVFRLVSVLPAHQTEEDEPMKKGADVVPKKEPEMQTTAPPERDSKSGTALGISSLLASAQNQAEQRMKLTPRVPVVVRLQEAKMWNVRVGAGVAAESNRQDAHGELDISSRNFLGGLRKLQWTSTLGYAWAPGLLFAGRQESARHGVILSSDLEFKQPWLSQRETNFRFRPSIDRDVRIGYILWNPGARISVDRRFFGHLTTGLGYRVSYYNFDYVDRDLATETPLGQDFQPEFLLEYLEQTITLDYRDSQLNPKKGWVAEASSQEATRYIFGGEFNYLKFAASVKGYIPFNLWTKWVLALKWTGGAIYNLEPRNFEDMENRTQRVPTTSRFYSGGKGSVRSLGRRELSVYKGTVPVGGLTRAEVSIEPRFLIRTNFFDVGDVWGTMFLDVGTVHQGQFLIGTPANEALQLGTVGPKEIASSLLYGLGIGLWWETPIGPVRADAAYTLNEYEVRRCPNQELVITGNPDCTPVSDANNPLSDTLTRFNFIIGIGHSF